MGYKEKVYTVPKSELKSSDFLKKGVHSSYHYSEFQLKDGTKLRGIVAEESKDSLTIKTDLGFITLEKKEIQETDYQNAPPPDFPEGWKQETALLPESRVGGGFLYWRNGAPFSSVNPVSLGGTFFIEPSLFKFSKASIGFKTSYLVSDNETKAKFFLNTAYLHFSKTFRDNPYLDFYLNTGIGVGQVSYQTRDRQKLTGIDPLISMEAGWQGIKKGSFFLRTGFTVNCLLERETVFISPGVEILLGVRF